MVTAALIAGRRIDDDPANAPRASARPPRRCARPFRMRRNLRRHETLDQANAAATHSLRRSKRIVTPARPKPSATAAYIVQRRIGNSFVMATHKRHPLAIHEHQDRKRGALSVRTDSHAALRRPIYRRWHNCQFTWNAPVDVLFSDS